MPSSIAALGVGLILFGPESYRGFVAIVQQFGVMLQHNLWPWTDFISAFAFARYFGVPQTAAMLFHAAIAAGAAILVWLAWSRGWEQKIPILAAATMLGSPYLLAYDATLMVVPAGYFVARHRYWTVGLLGLLCALPVLFVWGAYHGPNTIGIAAVVSLAALTFDRRRERNSPRQANSAPHAAVPRPVLP